MKHTTFLTGLCCLLLISCKSIGPNQIEIDSSRYNEALIHTHNEQLLKNIVRLRYLKPVSFLKVTNVTSSYTLTPAINATGSIVTGPTGISVTPTGQVSTGIVNPSVLYSDQPTISYVPVTGNEFTQRLLMPIPLENIALLLNGGVNDPQSLFNIIIASMDDYDNASNASDLRTISAPEYRKFRHLTTLFHRLEVRKWVNIRTEVVDERVVLVMHFVRHHSKEAHEIKARLHIPQHFHKIIFSDEKLPQANSVVIEIRSLLSALIFLSHGVQVPEEHIQNKSAPQYLVLPTKPYDWNPLMQGIFKVYTSKVVPTNAYIRIYMEGNWFYIAANDFNSIRTFIYMDTMHILASGNAFASVNQSPVLTIPTRT